MVPPVVVPPVVVPPVVVPPVVVPPVVVPPEVVPVKQTVIGLKIESSSSYLAGQTLTLKTFGVFQDPAESKEVVAEWKILSNEANLEQVGVGIFIGKKSGKVKLEAQYDSQVATIEFDIEMPGLLVKEEQFWIYRSEGQKLLFNNPWDEQPGSEVKRDHEGLPDYAETCLAAAKSRYEELKNKPAIKEKIGQLLLAGASPKLTYLVNVLPTEVKLDRLRRLDRDAYFWHWPQEDKRPSLAMNDFKQGLWVWELIASPNACLQPNELEFKRYLDYTAFRLGLKK